MSDEQSEFLKNVHKNDDVIFKQSDKCKGFVIMDRDDYLTKSHAILMMLETMKHLIKILFLRSKRKRRGYLGRYLKVSCLTVLYRSLLRVTAEFLYFMGCPKIIKSPFLSGR